MPIIMFHYVKEKSNYFHFNLNKFEDFVRKNKNKIVSLQEYIKGNNKDKIVLTFDDGTIDHYTNVFSVFKKYGVTGVFSVCDNVYEKYILDIQKIHKLMELVGTDKFFEQFISIYKKQSAEELLSEYGNKERVLKNLLQKVLDKTERKDILDNILKLNNINLDFNDLYLNQDNIKEMMEYGNEFIYHTKNHYWLGSLSKEQQKEELQNAKNYIDNYGFLNMVTFPFGDYNKDTMEILNKMEIDFVLGVKYTDNSKCLTRIDCIEIKGE